MTEAILRGVCSDCQKTYRVPSADRAYKCKACGGTVRVGKTPAAPVEAPEAPAGPMTCPACEAENPADSPFCDSCGESLTGGRRKSSTQRREAAMDLRRAHKWIKWIRGYYVFCAIIAGLALIGLIAAVGEPEVDMTRAVIGISLIATMAAASIVAVFRLPFQPFLWTVILASLQTLGFVVNLLNGEFSFFGAIWAFAFWMAVVPMVRVRRLVSDNPDLYMTHQLTGTRRARTRGGRGAEDAAEVHAQASRLAWRKSAIAAALVWGFSGVATWYTHSQVRPTDINDSREAFLEAWNGGDANRVADFFDPEAPASDSAWLLSALQARGWDEGLPDLDTWEAEATLRGHTVLFAGAEAQILTDWGFASGEWRITELELPPPSPEPMVLDMIKAWERSSAEEFAAFYKLSSREKIERYITSRANELEWGDSYPSILEYSVDLVTGRRASAFLELGEERITVRLELDDEDRWHAVRLSLPKR